MSLTAEKFKQALLLYENAEYTESWNILNQVIKDDPENDLAFYLFGIIYYRFGNTAEAIKHLELAISINPADDYIKDLADVYFDITDYEKAISLYKKVLAKHPDNVGILFNLGLASYSSKKYQEAIGAYTKVVELIPDDYEAYNNLGLSYYALDDFDNAVKCFSKAAGLKEDFHEAYNNMGNVLKLQNKLIESVESYKRAVELFPDCPHYHYNLGLAYYKINRLEDAVSCYNRYLAYNPDDATVLADLSIAYFHLNKLDEAVESAEKAVNNDPESYNANFYAGLAYYWSGDSARAKTFFKKAIEVNPENEMAQGICGWTHLIEQNFEEGFRYHEASLNLRDERKNMAKILKKPLWNGKDSLEGKTVYVFYELSLGDVIQFTRYIPLLSNLGAKVIYQSRPQLAKLFADSDLNVNVISCLQENTAEELEKLNLEFDYYVPLWMLGAYFTKTIDEIPYREGYLKADTQKTELFRKKYFDNDKYKIGLVWQCSNGAYSDLNRSVPHIDKFFPLAELSNIQLYSLQIGTSAGQLNDLPQGIEITDLAPAINDFSDTAAAIENLDLLISIDTSVAHLGGAMGKKTYALIMKNPEWRWFKEINYSPWYNSIKVYRQKEQFNWDEPILELIHDVKSEVSYIL